MRATDIVARVRAAGIVGAGGAGFPTHVKLGATVDTVIANGAECEPLLRVDQQLMVRDAALLVRGMVLAREATGAPRAVIALKRKYHAAEHALRAALGSSGVELFLLDNFYPAGDEQTLVNEVTGRTIPEGGIPLAAKVVVSNVCTLTQIARAVDDGEPVVDRWVTVTGAVAQPGTFCCPVGTPVSALIARAGGSTLPAGQWVYLAGGPMMGSVQSDVSRPVGKTDGGIVVLPADHYLVRKKQLSFLQQAKKARTACVQCVACTDVCPRRLLGHNLKPHVIMRAIGYGVHLSDETLRMAFLCCECGACTYFGCPMDLTPGAINSAIKRELAARGVKGPQGTAAPELSPLRKFRKIPVKRLISRLQLGAYDVDAPMADAPLTVPAVTIPLKQHVGAPAQATVTAGAAVTRGQVIGEIPEGKLAARVHASITGTITSVSATAVTIAATAAKAG
ncbi:MAG TPA: SLBB domain-containing protein [bacterium]|nr:SLBB domain-containing protein [bacterium]